VWTIVSAYRDRLFHHREPCTEPVSSAVRDLLASSNPFLAAVVTKGVDVATVAHLGRDPTVHQRTALEWLEPRCRAEGCDRTIGLDIDHRVDWAPTKVTLLKWLDWLCRHHHDLKTNEGLAARRRHRHPGLRPTRRSPSPRPRTTRTLRRLTDLERSRPATPGAPPRPGEAVRPQPPLPGSTRYASYTESMPRTVLMSESRWDGSPSSKSKRSLEMRSLPVVVVQAMMFTW
jgi:hypothetical protein